jgi:hypothetical protein
MTQLLIIIIFFPNLTIGYRPQIMTFIIAFLGRKRSGKNTAADITCRHYNLYERDMIEMSFAGSIKDTLMKLLSLDGKHFYNEEFKEIPLVHSGFTPRHLMQWYGNIMKEKFGADFWLNKVKSDIKTCGKKYVVITDVRFVEEVKMISELGGTIVYMNRDDILEPMSAAEDISEKVVYESRQWAKDNAIKYYEIDNNSNDIDALRCEIQTKLNI